MHDVWTSYRPCRRWPWGCRRARWRSRAGRATPGRPGARGPVRVRVEIVEFDVGCVSWVSWVGVGRSTDDRSETAIPRTPAPHLVDEREEGGRGDGLGLGENAEDGVLLHGHLLLVVLVPVFLGGVLGCVYRRGSCGPGVMAARWRRCVIYARPPFPSLPYYHNNPPTGARM